MDDDEDELENGETDTFVITVEDAKDKVYFKTKADDSGKWKSVKLDVVRRR